MKDKAAFRIATYNTHKSRGMDGRIQPLRIAKVLLELEADIIALQEVVSLSGGRKEQDQAQYLADTLGYEYRIGETRKLRGASYGNVVISRFPIKEVEIYDLTASQREARGCIRCDIEVAPGKVVHIFNIHLGTGYLERRKQANLLMSRKVLLAPKDLEDPLFNAKRRAHQEQRKQVEAIAARFAKIGQGMFNIQLKRGSTTNRRTRG